jgi:hypothetical protein
MQSNFSQQYFNQSTGKGISSILSTLSVFDSEGIKAIALGIKGMVMMFLGKY